jgi:hypothetical protein
MPDSAGLLGTRMPVKIAGTVDGLAFDATLMPLGNGNHMVPLRAAVRKQLAKGQGDEVSIHITQRVKKA